MLAYHSAIELLGLAHSVYRHVIYMTARPRKDVRLPGGRGRALRHPKPLRDRAAESFGVEAHERGGVTVRLTGPERCLMLLDQRRAFAIMGFVLEQAAERLFVPAALRDRLAAHRPVARIYLDKRQRGGRLQPRWNLIVPERWAPGVAHAEL